MIFEMIRLGGEFFSSIVFGTGWGMNLLMLLLCIYMAKNEAMEGDD